MAQEMDKEKYNRPTGETEKVVPLKAGQQSAYLKKVLPCMLTVLIIYYFILV